MRKFLFPPDGERPPQTALEHEWHKPHGHIFKSEPHGVMAVADAYPRMPLQVVVAPSYGLPGDKAHFSRLPREMKRKLHEVADAIEDKIAENCTDSQRVVTHTEGFGLEDHPHIVLFAAERGEGERLYNGPRLGDVAVQHTLDTVTFAFVEYEILELHLGQIR